MHDTVATAGECEPIWTEPFQNVANFLYIAKYYNKQLPSTTIALVSYSYSTYVQLQY